MIYAAFKSVDFNILSCLLFFYFLYFSTYDKLKLSLSVVKIHKLDWTYKRITQGTNKSILCIAIRNRVSWSYILALVKSSLASSSVANICLAFAVSAMLACVSILFCNNTWRKIISIATWSTCTCVWKWRWPKQIMIFIFMIFTNDIFHL